MLTVKKFAGSSAGSPEQLRNVARRCIEDYEKGDDIVAVISSGDTLAGALRKQAGVISGSPSKRELDMLMTTGAQGTAALLAMTLESLGVRAISLNAFQAGIHVTGRYGEARLKKIDGSRIVDELGDRTIVVVAGDQGVNAYHDLATLGPGGSNITAVELAGALKADSCEFYTDVDGIYTADPSICPRARVLRDVTYGEMMDLATLGTGSIQPECVERAKKYGIPLVIRSLEQKTEGTIVREETVLEKNLVSGVALDKKADRVSVLGLRDEPGVAYRLFDILAKAQVNVDQILQSLGHDGSEDISFTCPEDQVEKAVETLENSREKLPFTKIDVDRDTAKVMVTGSGMIGRPGVAAKLFEALYNENINISMISTSEFRITCIISRKDGEKAVNAIHDAFSLDKTFAE